MPEAKCAEIFLGERGAQREYVVALGKSVTLAWRSATTNEPFALATQEALPTPPSPQQPDTPKKSSNKRRLRQPASKASKKARGQLATYTSATAPASGAPSTQPAPLPPPLQLPALEALAPPDQRMVETSRGLPWDTSGGDDLRSFGACTLNWRPCTQSFT